MAKKPKGIEATFTEIRYAIKGWAFAPDDWIPKKITAAEMLRDSLPEEYRKEADDLIKPLRS